MKTKLLKKLRKRFSWYRTNHACWSYTDLKTGKSYYAYVCGFYRVNDMLIFEMLDKIGLKHLFINKRNKGKIIK